MLNGPTRSPRQPATTATPSSARAASLEPERQVFNRGAGVEPERQVFNRGAGVEPERQVFNRGASVEPEPSALNHRVIRLGVVGWPVSHSRSPAIHNGALRATGLGERWHYQLLPVPPDLFRETVLALPATGFRGVNVTIPHKEAALGLANEGSPRAVAIGAANTLVFEDAGRIVADNTDAPALIQELGERTQIRGASALVLGAGGSARAAVWALLDAGASEVLVWNRTLERAQRLASEMGARAVAAPSPEADILINCTSAGLQTAGQLEDLLPPTHRLERHRAVVDLVYREGGTPLVQAARERGVPTVDGLEMLVAQGAIAFKRFTGKAPPTDAMRAAVGLSSAT